LELSRQKQLVTTALSQYVSGAVVEQIMADPSRLRLGGERKTLTMLFSDLEGFSELAERLEPETLTALLNDYLSDMTDIILDQGGTLDKYQGDAIVAFWNAPLDQADHASRACRAALLCQRRLAERAEAYRSWVGAALKARIGIHTGEVVVGNMGSKARFDYSMLGDAANLAARLESANKAFGTRIMVSEATWLATGGAFLDREIGIIKVSGRTLPVRVFEPLAIQDSHSDHFPEAPGASHDSSVRAAAVSFDLTAYEQALSQCRAGRWAAAEAGFTALPEDALSRLYLARCRQAQAEGGWDGIWHLTGK
ncbi:MAG: adenylate/guanylate cyclase domain-containing protein, partial [Methylococcaceae bacterium]